MRISDLRITTLSENSVHSALVQGEWGLSILIDVGDRHILLDTGAGETVTKNAERLRIDLASVDTIVLSHNHFDHTGGLASVLGRIGGEVPVYAHPGIWGSNYSLNRKTGEARFIGVPYRREFLESLGARFHLSTEPQWIHQDIVTSGEVPMETEFESVAKNLVTRSDGEFSSDTVPDDLSLYIRTDAGVVVILGCAHRGVINVIRHARAFMQTDEVYLVVGGTHLIGATNERIEHTIEALREFDVKWLGVSHCTGFQAAARLATALPDRFFSNNAGNVIELPLE